MIITTVVDTTKLINQLIVDGKVIAEAPLKENAKDIEKAFSGTALAKKEAYANTRMA